MDSRHHALLGTLLALLVIDCSKPSAVHEVAASAHRDEVRPGDGATQADRPRAKQGSRSRFLHWIWVQDDNDDRDANDDGDNDEGDKE